MPLPEPITFDSKDIDQALWEARTLTEATRIFNKESTRRGRTWEQVYEKCKQGQAPEVWLLMKGYLDDSRDYHDVIRPDGEPIEVKTTDWESRYTLDRYRDKLMSFSDKAELAKTVYVFNNRPGESLYTFHGIFTWNGECFIGTRPQL